MSFENTIQKWVSIDNQIKIHNEKLRSLREEKSNLNEILLRQGSTNNLLNNTIQISDGKLKFVNTKISPPLTFKYVEKSLGDIIKNEDQVKRIMDYLKNHRDIKNVQEIKRYSN
jgi:hypothetical protein